MKAKIYTGILLGAMVLGTEAKAQSTGTNNILSAAEKEDGYKLLWDGTSFTGWKSYHLSNVSGTWSIVHQSGLETTSRKSVDPDSNILEVNASGQSMFTVDTSFQDFDYKVEWKAVVGLKGNSGLIIHYREAAGEYNGASGPEAQVSNTLWTQEWTAELTAAGCNYEMTPLLKSRKNPDNSPNWVKPDGQWNEFRIISYGKRVAHYGNGKRLLEYQMFSPAWTAAYKASKYNQYPNYNNLHPGSIYLQNHGEKWMKFRNLRIKKLTQNPWGSDSPYLNKSSATPTDSTLIDDLALSADLFPNTTRVSPYAIVPKEARIVSQPQGLSVLFARSGDYSVRLQDLNGVTTLVNNVKGKDQIFLPGRFTRPRILSVYQAGKQIQSSIVGGK